MRVLIVASGNGGGMAPFVEEQAEALRKAGVEVRLFLVEGHGVMGYLRNLTRLKDDLNTTLTHLIHCHYGLCGLLATLQHRVPVVTTYHGSDVNDPKVLPFSRLAARRSRFNIFVSTRLASRCGASRSRSAVLPCGVDTSLFRPISRAEARLQLGLDPSARYVLFAGAFANAVKNAPLAKAAVALLPGVKLLELSGYSRREVALLMNAADVLLMTSHSEGSPQVVKEALACAQPVVSVSVGDVPLLLDGVEGCHVVARDPQVIASALVRAMATGRTNGPGRVAALELDNAQVAQKLLSIYKNILAPK
ncbi:MAG: glycosyltransferase [Bacteroidales bacterium]|nr:glycosyltransferase [Bacteroidales bacterium]